MAVIGKVGTYAQVQPLQGPDFGKMVKDQFDKMDADKKAAAEKKRKEAEAKAKSLEKLDFGVYEGGLPPAVDEQLTNLTEAKRQEFYKYKEAGDIVNAEKVSKFIPKINALAKQAKEKTSKLEKDLSSGALYDKDYLSKTMEELNAYDKEDFILADKDGDIYITLLSEETDENGKRKILAPEQTVSSWLAKIDPPLAFDDQKALNRFKANNPVSKIETKSGMMFTTAEDVMKDPTVVQNINEYVSALSNSDSAMAKWYKDTKGEFKTRGFSKDEKEEFIKDNVDIYKNAYKESISLDLEQRRSGGAGKEDKVSVGVPTLLEKKEVDGINKHKFSPSSRVVSITQGKTPIKINDLFVNQFIIDKESNKAYVGLSTNISGRGDGFSASGKNSEYLDFDDPQADIAGFRSRFSAQTGLNFVTNGDLINYLYDGTKPPKRDKYGVIITE
jgi:hypothetical protein